MLMPMRPASLAAIGCLALGACGGDGARPSTPNPTGELSRAMSAYVPTAPTDCSGEVHARFNTVGPDGKLYPTWHPPVDPASGCSFGHEHGRDPAGSNIGRNVGPIPFGYANEQLDIFAPSIPRHEDHVGHKVEWENDVAFQVGDGISSAFFTITCDILTKLHQGTHSKDAFTNNLHELVYDIDCSDGTRMYITIMATIGKPGEFHRTCSSGTAVFVGVASPANSPAGGGKRVIPDRGCVEQHLLVGSGANSNYSAALHENWQVSQSIRTAENRTLASFNPYYQVSFPSRFHDPDLATLTGRPIAACYETEANGDRARGGLCAEAAAAGVQAFDDPRSPFNGVKRKVDINSNRVINADGPEVWYTDPFGKNGRTEPFPGAIRQVIGKINNERGFSFSGPTIGGNRTYGGSGTHAPN